MLSKDEKALLGDVLEWWEAGLNEAVEAITADDTNETLDELLENTNDIGTQKRHIGSIRDKLGL